MPSRIPTETGAFLHATPPEARAPGGAPATDGAGEVAPGDGSVERADEAGMPALTPPDPSEADGIDWLPWGTAAFARAQAGGRPVLLSIVTTWSAACRAQEAELFGAPSRHPDLQRLIRDLSVPVRVDADRRPDIADRYTHGGWPTTLLLTPEGDPLAGGADLDAAQLTRSIAAAAAALSTQRHDLARQADALRAERRAEPPPQGPAPADEGWEDEALAWMGDCLLASFDREHGGFFTHAEDEAGAKFPLAAPLAFALWQGSRTGDTRLVDLALVSLERMSASALSAPDGAFYRCGASPDWARPDEAKLLETQAELIPLYLDAWTLSGADAFRDRALAGLDFVFRTLTDPVRGGFFTSQAPDGSVDRVLLTDANAKMVSALVRAGRVLDDATLVERAARALERLLPVVYRRRGGVAHLLVPAGVVGASGTTGVAGVPSATGAAGATAGAPSPRIPPTASASPALAALAGGARASADGDVAQVRGLLVDQVQISSALLDAGVAAGEPVYIELAEELMRSALRSLSHPSGGLVDRIRSAAGAGDVGLLGDALRPFAANAAAARVLWRLGRDASRPDLLEAARATVRPLAGVYRQHDVSSAELGLTLLTFR